MAFEADALLHYLDARVHAKPLPRRQDPGLRRRLCVGVRTGGVTHWWVAELGGTPETHFADALPRDFDAGIAMDANTALWVLGRERERGTLHLTTGDPDLVDWFKREYLHSADLFSQRLRGTL